MEYKKITKKNITENKNKNFFINDKKWKQKNLETWIEIIYEIEPYSSRSW